MQARRSARKNNDADDAGSASTILAHFCILCCLCPSLRPSLHFATIHLCFIRRNQEAPSACQVAVIWSLLYSTFFYSLRTPSLLLYRSVTIALDRRLGIQAASFLDWIRCLSTAACRNWISPLVLRVVRSLSELDGLSGGFRNYIYFNIFGTIVKNIATNTNMITRLSVASAHSVQVD